jgi:two-component system, sensor histidine kinase
MCRLPPKVKESESMARDARSREDRILILAPTGKDAVLAQEILERAGLFGFRCCQMTEVLAELNVGAGALLIAEEAFADDPAGTLAAWLGQQPPWSDLPVLVLARPGANSAAVRGAIEQLGNVTVVERPTRVATLVSVVRTALRSRQRQYQIREHLRERANAEVALRDADRRKNEFLAILAHELRNPLAPIRNSLHILRLSLPDDPAVTRIGEMLERQVKHIVRLVDDLLEMSRITRGKIELRRERVELAAVVRSAVETSQPLIDAAHHRLAISIPAQPLTVDGDPVRLAQVVANLLNNAAKYTEPGGQIWLTVRGEGTEAVVSVRDSGTGIAAENLREVFELFTQIDGPQMRTQGGLGIGLSLVKSLVEMHGGTVSVRSEGLGKGSEFLVRLPLAVEPARSRVEAAPAKSAPGAPAHRVLVVDDNRDAAESLRMVLELLGVDVRVAFSGQDALKLLDSYRPTVVLLDIGMPEMDGHEVAREIRRRPEFRDATLIAITGWGQEEDHRRSHAAGFDYHLTKPADPNTLRTLLVSLDRR